MHNLSAKASLKVAIEKTGKDMKINMAVINFFNLLYKHTTQKLCICDPQTQLNNFFTLPKISLHVSAPTGHLQVIFLKISYSTLLLLPTLGPGVYSGSNRNKYLISEHLAQNKGHGRFSRSW
jgi:hypothetical protein